MSDRSVSAESISKSVVVTGDGNAVSLTFGASGPVLPLDRKQIRVNDRLGGARRELDILSPDRSTLPLIGRDDELADLRSWLDAEADISVHSLIGRAGSGKIRLAIELCKRIDGGQAPGEDWVAGFLSVSELERVAEVYATSVFGWKQSTLLVIDYAGEDHASLGRWLDRLATQRLDVKLRILLLDREAPQGFGWWHELTGSTLHAAADRRRLFRGGTLHARALVGLADLEDRRDVVAAALKAVQEIHPEGSTVAIPAAGADSDFDAQLGQSRFANPLSLVMAGLIARERGPRAAVALRRLDAARHLARRELDRFALLAGEDQAPAIRHLVAFNGLLGGAPLASLNERLAAELEAVRLTGDVGRLAELLRQELPPSVTRQAGTPRLGTVQPNLIGEGAIVEAFETAPPAIGMAGAETVRRAYAETGGAAAAALMRLLQDFAHALEDATTTADERQTATMVMGWLTELADGIDTPEDLEPLAFAFPDQTLILREAALDLTKRLADAWRRIHAESGDLVDADRASAWLNNLAARLSALGQREAALAAAEESVRLRRTLTEARSDAFTPDLAMSLNNMANRLSELGQQEASLAAAEEAGRLYRTLAEARPDAFTPDLAMSLNNLANRLSELGRQEASLSAAEEAVRLYRTLAEARPDAFTPDLAMSLNNLANSLSDLGRREAALGAAEEAVRLRRALAEARPDAFTRALATSLNNLATMLGDLGRREAALAAAEEAVRLYRGLAEVRLYAFTPELAPSLSNLATMLGDLGRREAALAAAEEAVRLYRGLAEARPDAFTVGLSTSLGMFTDIQFANGAKGAALDSITEAIRILAPVFLRLPQAVARWMGMHLQRYIQLCTELEQDPDMSLVDPLIEVFRELQQGENRKGDEGVIKGNLETQTDE